MATPQGWHSITPRLIVQDPESLIAFLERAFDASVERYERGPAVVRIGDSNVMVSDGGGLRQPASSLLHLYVDDCDATFAKAMAAGAVPVEKPAEMPWGDRRCTITDPSGNGWQIATHRA